MAESFFEYQRNIYCVKNRYQYHKLKTVVGKIRYGVLYHKKEAIEVQHETCQDLVNECQAKFGRDFVYIQSGVDYASQWDSVKASGVICQHIFDY